MHRGISTSFSDVVLVTCKHFLSGILFLYKHLQKLIGLYPVAILCSLEILSSSLKEYDAETLLSLGQNSVQVEFELNSNNNSQMPAPWPHSEESYW